MPMYELVVIYKLILWKIMKGSSRQSGAISTEKNIDMCYHVSDHVLRFQDNYSQLSR